MHRPLLRSAPVLLAAALALSGAHAAPFPGLYAVTVPGTDAQKSAQDAMRVVLVRLTGQREAATDASLAPLVADARRYTQLLRATVGGATQVMFDGTALRAALMAAGRTPWDLDRPLVLVTLTAPPAALEDTRQRLQAEAQARGLPILFSNDAGAVTADHDALLFAARRAGASAALLGRSGADGALQWTLATAATGGNWSGPAESGIDETVDALVRSAHDIESEPLADVNCHISGVSDLNAFAAVLDIVAATPGVTDVAVQNVDADGISLRLHARASGESLARALAGERLKAVSDSGGALEYRYQATP